MTPIAPLSEFRPIGGIGNNLTNPELNPVPNSPELAVAPPKFAPGTTDQPIDGPNARTISNVVAGGPGADVTDPAASAWLYAFGQFVDHDLDLETTNTTPINIPVPNGDPTFPDGSTILLNRAVTDPTTHTIVNSIAGDLDLSQVYGSDTASAASLRNTDGTLVTSAGDNLPLVNGMFVSGDARVMENPELTAITTLFVREHNFWVGQLHEQHPTWTGDQLYSMAKAITTAEYQNIVYSEYLPSLIGGAAGPYTGYDPAVNPQVTQEFSTAAFRVGHSQVSGTQTGTSNNGQMSFQQTLEQSFFNTPGQDQTNGVNALLRNLSSDLSQATDPYAVDALRNLLATNPDKMDLIAIDIQRERDVGLGTLNETRHALGLAPYTSFDQLMGDPTVQANLLNTFGDIDNVDLFMGGLAETHAPGSAVGPTFQTIIADQFNALRAGDRFFWLNQNFDPATQNLIQHSTLSAILERNTGTIVEQQNVFLAAERHLSSEPPTDESQLIIGVDDPGATLAGGPANDTIVAGLGLNQILTGGGGTNVFVYNGGGHADTLSDFHPAVDKIEFQNQPAQLSALATETVITATDFNDSTVLAFNGNNVVLTGVTSSSLQPSNFVFGGQVDLVINHPTVPIG